MLSMYKQITILTLHQKGKTNSEIAQTLGGHRNTVCKILKRNRPVEKQTRQKPSELDCHDGRIKQWLGQKITRVRIYEKLLEEGGIRSTYANLCDYIRKHFPPFTEAYGVQLTAPGEEAELDFGYLGMVPGKDGHLTKTFGLAVILAYSRVGYYAICYDQKLDTLCSALQEAFAYFGGVPRKLKVDNMKTAVVRNTRAELDFNPDFLEFARHYNMVIVPCTPYSPEQKGKVEAGIKYLQGNFINGRTFTDDRDIARQLTDWMRNYANQRVHGTTRKVPWQELVNTERAALQRVPAEGYSFFERTVRSVHRNSHIHFENVYYSVPCRFVGESVTVRFNDRIISVIARGEQIALHPRATQEGMYVTVREHLPAEKIYSETEHQAKAEAQMRAIGEAAHEYFHMLLKAKAGYWTQTIRGILALSQHYDAGTVNLSLRRALHYGATDLPTIKHILEKKLYLLPPEPILPKIADEEPVLARELTYYTVYDADTVSVAT